MSRVSRWIPSTGSICNWSMVRTCSATRSTKVCTDVIIINDREVALACGNELVDVNDIRYGIDAIR